MGKSLAQRAQAAKSTYKSCLRELDQISTAVHAKRQQFAVAAAAGEPEGAASDSGMSTDRKGDLRELTEEEAKWSLDSRPKLEATMAAVFGDDSPPRAHPPEVSPEPPEGAEAGGAA